MEQHDRNMRSIKAAAKEELGHIRGVEGLGLGEGVLRVYVRNAEVRKRLPSEYRGVPVESVVTGEISALSANS